MGQNITWFCSDFRIPCFDICHCGVRIRRAHTCFYFDKVAPSRNLGLAVIRGCVMAQLCQKKTSVHAKAGWSRMSNETAAPLPGFHRKRPRSLEQPWQEKSAFNFDEKIDHRILRGTFLLYKSKYCEKLSIIDFYRTLKKVCRILDFEACWTSSQASEVTTYDL